MSFALPRTQRAFPDGPIAAVRANAAELTTIGLLIAVAFGLRLSQIHQSLVGDEVFTYQDVFGRSFVSVLSTVHTGIENTPPLFFVLAWASAHLGDPTVWIRVPSIVLGTATVPVVYALGRATIGRVGGLIGAAIIALAPFAVYFGIEARSYATFTFFIAFSTLALLHAVRTRSTLWWVVYALSVAAAAYTHYTSIFLLGVQAAWSFWACRDRLRQPLLAHALIVLLYLPWLPHVRGKAVAVIGGLYPLGVHRVLTDLLRPIPGHPGAPLRAIPTTLGLVAVGACALAGLVATVIRWSRTSPGAAQPRLPTKLTLLVALAAATPVGLLLYSLVSTDLWLPRYLSSSLPAAALVLGALLAALPRPLTVLTVAVVITTLVAGTIRSFHAAYTRGPYRAIAGDLDRVAGPRDPISIVSLLGGAVRVQFHKPHVVLTSTTNMSRSVPPGGSAYVVLDDTIARALKIGTLQVQGLQLVARRHYAGNFPTDLLTYRRQGIAQ